MDDRHFKLLLFVAPTSHVAVHTRESGDTFQEVFGR